MRIEAYFQQLRDTIDSCPVVNSFDVTYDKRGSHEGFIRGEVHFVDGSMLHLREFVDVESGLERLTYVYHYVDPAKKLVFRAGFRKTTTRAPAVKIGGVGRSRISTTAMSAPLRSSLSPFSTAVTPSSSPMTSSPLCPATVGTGNPGIST